MEVFNNVFNWEIRDALTKTYFAHRTKPTTFRPNVATIVEGNYKIKI